MKSNNTNPYAIISKQDDIHKDCLALALKHQRNDYLAPIPGHQRAVFDTLYERLPSAPIILDSGCGTGMSTSYLASEYPDHMIVGVDKSLHRLNKHNTFTDEISQIEENAFLVRADLNHFWRLALASDLNVEKHTLFYPNPWPKDIQKRFHGHPISHTLFTLCPHNVMRTNWNIYAREFALVAEQAYGLRVKTREIITEKPVSLFESKYLTHRETCYEISTQPAE